MIKIAIIGDDSGALTRAVQELVDRDSLPGVSLYTPCNLAKLGMGAGKPVPETKDDFLDGVLPWPGKPAH